MKAVERIALFLAALSIILSAFSVALLPILDFVDWEIPYLNPNLVEALQFIDFPENSVEVLEFRGRIGLYIIVLVLFSTCLFLGSTVVRKTARVKSVSRQFRKFSELFAKNFQHNFERIESLEILGSTVPADYIGEGSVDDERILQIFDKITVSNKEFLREVCNQLENISRTYFGRSCAVNIKSYSFRSESVETIARDGKSHDARKHIDNRYKSFKRQSSYNSIFSELLAGSCNHFVSNNLIKLERVGDYQNHANPDWQKFYRACVFVPIRSKLSTDVKRSTLGFICIDSMNGRFSEDYFLELNKIVAEILHTYFEIIISRASVKESLFAPDREAVTNTKEKSVEQ